MATDPDELLRAIERTREELERTVDIIAERLDPRRAISRGVGALRTQADDLLASTNSAKDRLLHSLRRSDSNGSAPEHTEVDAEQPAASRKPPGWPAGARLEELPKPAVGVAVGALAAFTAVLVWQRRRRRSR